MTENPLTARLKGYRVLLASGSPRRQEYLRAMGIPFEYVKNHVDESYPSHLQGAGISDFLALLKAKSLSNTLKAKEILITADTVVWHRGTSLAKPADLEDTIRMLDTLSDDWHQVITSVCFTSLKKQVVVNCTTEVKFKALKKDEIVYYAEHFKPYDKAGGYGIQEWLGMIAIQEIRGSYPNVVGLPTFECYTTLNKLLDEM